MLCAGYLQRANIDATPDPPSLSVKLCSRTSKSLSLGGCWRPLFPILTVNFSGIKWALHHVPYIFCLFLTSATSFGWVVIARTSVPKIRKMDKILGRPAYPRPAGLAPQHTMPRNFSRVIMSTNPSQSNLVSSKFTNKDRKAWAMEGWVHFQCPNAVSRPKPPWARMCNREQSRQDG